jgi:cell division ATPase FtsA
VGAVEAAKRNLAMPVHIGIPGKVNGLIDEIILPAFATSIGLLHYGAQNRKTEQSSSFSNFGKIGQRFQAKGLAGKVLDLIKSFLP